MVMRKSMLGLTAQSIRRCSWQRCLTSSQPALPVSTSSGRTAGPIASRFQGGIEAAAEVAGAIDTTAYTDRQHGRRSQGGGGPSSMESAGFGVYIAAS